MLPLSHCPMMQAIDSLARRGATINELNAFRKSISCTKGGRLSEAAFPAKVGACKQITFHESLFF